MFWFELITVQTADYIICIVDLQIQEASFNKSGKNELHNVGPSTSGVLWSILSELRKRNNEVQMSERLPYRISREKFMGYKEFKALCKLGFIVNLYEWKRNFPNNIYWKPPTSNFHQNCETVYGVQKKVHLESSANWSLLWINILLPAGLQYVHRKVCKF
jgi:hypothetical protein